MVRRIILIILDGLGVGALPDAGQYGDGGSNTIGNLARRLGGLDLPNLTALGIGNLTEIQGVPPTPDTRGAHGRCAELSAGKDSISGHWEIMGVVTETPFPVYPDGFPDELLADFANRIGREVLSGKPASGTEIIDRLGDEHVRTAKPIVYTSADSVFQIAAHEKIIPVEELLELCRRARELLQGVHGVARVIARPFVGTSGKYRRTTNRHDFPLPPPAHVLDRLNQAGVPVIGIGKIGDLYAHRAISSEIHTRSNAEGMTAILDQTDPFRTGLVMANLVDFDQNWGHRNDCEGFAAGLQQFDRWLPALWKTLTPGDLVIVTADHGVDPTTRSTDHSREYVPVLTCGPGLPAGVNIGTRTTFADIGATVAEAFSVRPMPVGISFLQQLTRSSTVGSGGGE